MNVNMAQAGYYRLPTFESRTNFTLSLIEEWDAVGYDKDAISTEMSKLAKLAATRNSWVHGDWCATIDRSETVVFNHRADPNSVKRRKPVKAHDVEDHCRTVKQRTSKLAELIDLAGIDP